MDIQAVLQLILEVNRDSFRRNKLKLGGHEETGYYKRKALHVLREESCVLCLSCTASLRSASSGKRLQARAYVHNPFMGFLSSGGRRIFR